MKDISIGFSPCPNDTFIFYALMHEKIQNDEYHFKQTVEDVETLNQMALGSKLDVTKVSCHVLGHIRDEYCLLRSGGAMGRGCGPLVVAREKCDINDLVGKKIAIPGRHTTAFLLLRLHNPAFGDNVIFMPFDKIMESVKNGEADAGVIIHESRFTYHVYGLHEVLDLGEWWENDTGLPIPLGAIVAKRELGVDVVGGIERLVKASIEYAFLHKHEAMPYIKKHAQEISVDVIGKHIDLYVNEFSLDIGNEGRNAIKKLIDMAEERGIFRRNSLPLFSS